jgi:hypothetical protein
MYSIRTVIIIVDNFTLCSGYVCLVTLAYILSFRHYSVVIQERYVVLTENHCLLAVVVNGSW